MTASIIINEKRAADFNSVAWVTFGAWVDTLPMPQFELVIHLWEHGWVEPVAQLRFQLVTASKRFPPKNRSAKAIADDMLRLLIDPRFDDESKGVVIVSDDEDE